MKCSRRQLLEGLGIATLGGLLISACQGIPLGGSAPGLPTATTTTCGPSTCIDLADVTNAPLAKVGGSMLIDVGTDTLLVVRVSDTEIVAVSAICTHAGELVRYNPTGKLINCPAHGSQFDMTGKVTRGPARAALHDYVASIANNTITIEAA